MKDYSKAKIYSIRSAQTDKVYIGSTVETLARRLAVHRSYYKTWDKNKKYYTSFELLKYPDHYIELIENYPCDGVEELERHEGEITRATPNYVNKVIARRTRQEYRRDNIEHIRQRDRNYQQVHKDELSQYNKQYQEINRATIQLKKKEYRQDHSEHIKQKHECLCGGSYTTYHISRHNQSKKHQDYEQFMALTEDQINAMLN
jgi:hypothetical protein